MADRRSIIDRRDAKNVEIQAEMKQVTLSRRSESDNPYA